MATLTSVSVERIKFMLGDGFLSIFTIEEISGGGAESKGHQKNA
jgi:hypothetical protein